MIDFDKMTVAEHEAYKEMVRKVEALDELQEGEFVFKDKEGTLKKARQADITLMVLKAQAFDRVVESYEYFNGYKIKDLQNIGMDVLGIVGRYRTESGDCP